MITLEHHNTTSVITMDDGKVNVLSPSMQAELMGAFDEIEARESTRSVVLAGRPGVFSAGYDLSVMATGDMKAVVEMVASGGELVRRLYGFRVPVLAAATGHALAGGAFTILGCDVRIGSDRPAGTEGAAKVGMNEVAIGMVVPAWAITIAAHRLSNRHLNRSLMNARITDGPGAIDVGFFDQVVAPDQILDRTMAEAAAMDALDPKAYIGMIAAYRGDTLAAMDAHIASDRASVA